MASGTLPSATFPPAINNSKLDTGLGKTLLINIKSTFCLSGMVINKLFPEAHSRLSARYSTIRMATTHKTKGHSGPRWGRARKDKTVSPR